jgi:hypothetical protein
MFSTVPIMVCKDNDILSRTDTVVPIRHLGRSAGFRDNDDPRKDKSLRYKLGLVTTAASATTFIMDEENDQLQQQYKE